MTPVKCSRQVSRGIIIFILGIILPVVQYVKHCCVTIENPVSIYLKKIVGADRHMKSYTI
jgi:hypothetical protein